jgi:hypothetical protein
VRSRREGSAAVKELLVPVVTFGRVFDTVPSPEVLTLRELVAALHRFELKPQTLAAIAREQQRIDRALEGWRRGAPPRGKVAGKLTKVAEEARREGRDADAAVVERAALLEDEARRGAKRDLRLWSPAVYRPGTRERGTRNVTHVSCLVLDYDDGTPMEEASLLFEPWFHIVHSTWSHSEEHPKFRLVLPLAFPIPAADWGAVWAWAEDRAHSAIDPSMKSPAANYALPAVPHAEWPRRAFSRPGRLLDGVEEGLVARPSKLSLRRHGPLDGSPSVMRGQDPDKRYLDHEPALAAVLEGPMVEPPEEAAAPDRPGVRVEGHPLVAALERLAERWRRGELDEAEAARAKALLLESPAEGVPVGTRRQRRTLCVDFDGVLHSYASGWQGATTIGDPPVEGAIAFLEEAAEQFEIAIFSSRSHLPGGVAAMRSWLALQGLAEETLVRISFPTHKPAAELYLDDRAWRFEGTFPRLSELGDLSPWWTPRRGRR